MTTLNDTVSILSGGETSVTYSSSQTWYYNHDSEAFTSGPDLLEGRQLHGSSTIADNVTKAKIIVVTGGLDDGLDGLETTELLINGQWETGTTGCIILKWTELNGSEG